MKPELIGTAEREAGEEVEEVAKLRKEAARLIESAPSADLCRGDFRVNSAELTLEDLLLWKRVINKEADLKEVDEYLKGLSGAGENRRGWFDYVRKRAAASRLEAGMALAMRREIFDAYGEEDPHFSSIDWRLLDTKSVELWHALSDLKKAIEAKDKSARDQALFFESDILPGYDKHILSAPSGPAAQSINSFGAFIRNKFFSLLIAAGIFE